MSETRDFLRSIGLPPGDLNDLPDSEKRFPDGAQYRLEIPSTEGPRCLDAVLEEANGHEVRIHRISQGSGVFLQTDAELDEMAVTAADARVEVSLFARDRPDIVAAQLALVPLPNADARTVVTIHRHPKTKIRLIRGTGMDRA